MVEERPLAEIGEGLFLSVIGHSPAQLSHVALTLFDKMVVIATAVALPDQVS